MGVERQLRDVEEHGIQPHDMAGELGQEAVTKAREIARVTGKPAVVYQTYSQGQVNRTDAVGAYSLLPRGAEIVLWVSTDSTERLRGAWMHE